LGSGYGAENPAAFTGYKRAFKVKPYTTEHKYIYADTSVNLGLRFLQRT